MTTGLNLARGLHTTKEPHILTEVHNGWSSGWLARITLPFEDAPKFDLDREFIEPTTRALSRAGNGAKTYDLADLGDGIYEADSVWRSMQSHRVYFEIRDHAVAQVFDNKRAAKAALAAMVEA